MSKVTTRDASGAAVTDTVRLRRRAIEITRRVQQVVLFTAVNLKVIRDEKLYLHMGYSNIEDFVKAEFSMSRPQAYTYMALADTFSPNASILEDLTVCLTDNLDEEDAIKERFKELSRLGVNKLTEIRKLGDGSARELVENDQVTLHDGTVLTRDQIDHFTTRELSDQILKHKQDRLGWMDERQRLESKLEKEKSEAAGAAADLEKTRAELDEMRKEYLRLRSQLPEGKKTLADLRSVLSEAQTSMMAASSLLSDVPDLMEYGDEGLFELARSIRLLSNMLSDLSESIYSSDMAPIGSPDFDMEKAFRDLHEGSDDRVNLN